MNGTTPGTNYDQLVVSGDVSLDGRINIQRLDGYTPPTGETFQVISCGGTLSGEFSELVGAYVDRSTLFAADYTPTSASLFTRSTKPHEQWAWDRFGTDINDPSISGWFKDPEGDGAVNILEYAFALNPLLVDSANLLTYQMVENSGNDYLSITFTRPADAININYLPRVTGNLLGTWDTGASFTEIHQIIDNGDTETLTIRDKVSLGSVPSRFMTIDIEVLDE